MRLQLRWGGAVMAWHSVCVGVREGRVGAGQLPPQVQVPVDVAWSPDEAGTHTTLPSSQGLACIFYPGTISYP
eukprot:312230-Chlamydomonas_euryale.AAC.1